MTTDLINKKELQNKLQGFQEGKDYSVSAAKNGRQVYNIHSEELKKIFGSNIVYCKIETYDEENYHYRGRFDGYENGSRYSHQVWWTGEDFNPENHPDFENFDNKWRDFHDQNFLNSITSWGREIGNVFDDWKIKNEFFNQTKIKSFKMTKTNFFPGTGDSDKRYCANHGCWNVDKAVCSNDNFCQYCGKFFDRARTEPSHPREVANQPKPELERIRQLELENEQNQQVKNQQIANLEEQNGILNQQLAEEQQAKKKVAEQAQAERDNLQNELNQLRQELSQTQEKIIQLSAELKTELEKTSNLDTEKAVEQLTKTRQKLKKIDQLTPKTNPKDEQLNSLREQLNNSQQILVAAAAHRQSLIQAKQVQPQTEIKPTTLSQPKNRVPYLVGGLFLFGVSILTLGYFLGKKRKKLK